MYIFNCCIYMNINSMYVSNFYVYLYKNLHNLLYKIEYTVSDAAAS